MTGSERLPGDDVVADVLRQVMRLHRIKSLGELSRRVPGLSASTVTAWMRGGRRPTVAALFNVLEALGHRPGIVLDADPSAVDPVDAELGAALAAVLVGLGWTKPGPRTGGAR